MRFYKSLYTYVLLGMSLAGLSPGPAVPAQAVVSQWCEGRLPKTT